MADANEMYDTIMRELNDVVLSDTDESEEQQSFSFHEEAGFDDIPTSLLSYFETSKSRAAVCEKLILEDLEDFTVSHHTEDMTNSSIGLDKDMMKLNEQVICDPQNEENDTSTDARLLPEPTEAETLSDRLCTHTVSLCPNNEDEAGTNMESEEHLLFETRTFDIPLNDEERKKMSEYEEEQKKRQYEEMKMEEHKRQIERDFQEELRKIMEAEKLHQKEIELMEKRAQEKLEQEFLLQQELISNLQRRVEEERRMREEEQNRMKKEEDKRKREEEKVKMEAERKRKEEERRMREEEQNRMKEEEDKRKREEEKVKMKAERKRKEEERRMREEEQRRMREEEDKRKREEEKVKMETERKRQEEERRMREEEDKRKREEEKVKMEAERRRMEEETRRKKEEEIQIEEMKLKKEEEERRRMEREEKSREERIKIDLERRKLEDEVRMMKEEEKKERAEEVERKKKEEKEKRKTEEEKQNKIEEATKEMEKMETKRKMMIEIRLKNADECRKKKERKDKEERVTKEIEKRKKQDGVTEKKKEADDRKKMAQEKMDEEMRKGDKNGNVDEEIKLERKKTEENHRKRLEEEKDQEGENRKIKEELRPIVEDEKKNRDERKAGEEERGRRQKEKMRRPRDEDTYRKSEEDMRLKEENYLDNRKMEYKSKTKDEQNKQEEEKRKRNEGRKKIESEKEQNGENVEENKEEVKTMGEEMRIKEKERSKNRMMQVWEKEVKVVKAHELQEKREEHSMKGQNEKKHIDKTENSSQREDGTSWSSSSLVSMICPTGSEAIPQQQDLDKKISQNSARPSIGSVSLPVCLPEHTEQRRLSWMKDCIPWSKLSLQNRRKQKGSVRSWRGLRRAAEASSLPPLCPESLLQSTGWKSLQEVTTVTLEDLPGCSLSTLAQCTQLRSLSLRRCGLKSLEGINHLAQLCYIDVQENDISFINCENIICLRVLKLGHNKLTSIHGLAGAENLDVLDLSHNSITRIAGLESVRRLQRLSVDHNQLISTKGLRDVYTLLHLNCSNNHLASVEGLENSALLNTLDLRANSLTEPPSLNNQVLLRKLHLDDNSISSLQSLTACWLPLLQHLSVPQNRITQLPSISDFVSLENLDLRFNCMSELQTVCESLEGCHLLQEVHLTGNPLQQESGWRSTLQKAVPGLRVIDDQETDSSLSPPAAQQVSLASGSFIAFCQAQLQQTRDLQQQHSRELSKASSSLDAVKSSCRHFIEALQLAADQRFAHEYGDTNVADRHRAAGQTIPEETVDMGSANAEKHSERPEMESTEKVPPVIPISDNIRCSYWTLNEKSAAESRHDTFDTDTTGPQTGPTVSKANSGSVNSLARKRKTNSTNLKMAPVFNLDLQIAAAVVIQQLWRKYRQKCGNISSPSTAEKRGGRGGDGVKPGPGPSYINGSVVGQNHAATVIQAFWRGFILRRRLASALAAVTCSDSGEDDTFEEVDMDEFVFDEAAMENHWTLPLSEDSPLRRYPVSEQPLSLKPPRPFPEHSHYILPPPVERKSKQAWVAPEQVDFERQGVSPLSSNRSKSPASTSAVSGLSKRSEKILEEWGFTNHHTALLMLKRAQNMKSKKHQQKRRRDPSVRLALFRNCGFQPGPVEARNRKARHNSSDIKAREAKLGLQQAEKTERVKQNQARLWLHNQAAHSDRDSESVHFLPEISSDILNGGRVQLVADPGYTERLHHASGLWANSSLTAQPCRENNYPRRNSLGHAREEVPSPKGATSAPSIKERISIRDNPVQLSGGWGGGKKRGKVYK